MLLPTDTLTNNSDTLLGLPLGTTSASKNRSGRSLVYQSLNHVSYETPPSDADSFLDLSYVPSLPMLPCRCKSAFRSLALLAIPLMDTDPSLMGRPDLFLALGVLKMSFPPLDHSDDLRYW